MPKRWSSARLASRPSVILFRLVITAAVSVSVAAAMQFGVRSLTSRQDTDLADALQTYAATGTEVSARRVYPYSIVAGGVQSSNEVARAMADDLTVAAHYKGLDPSRLRIEHASGSERAYASYRRGDRVYWTSHPIALNGGEAILTDGVTKLRARCGNKLSDVPQQPVSPDEPDEIAFEQVEDLPGALRLDPLIANAVDPRVAAGESDPKSPFRHGPPAGYLVPIALGGPGHPGDGSNAVLGGPPIGTQPVNGEPIVVLPAQEPSPSGETDPGSIFLDGSQAPYLMPTGLIDLIDPWDPDVSAFAVSGDPVVVSPIEGESLTSVPVPEPGTITLVSLGLAAAVFHARRRRAEPATVDS